MNNQDFNRVFSAPVKTEMTQEQIAQSIMSIPERLRTPVQTAALGLVQGSWLCRIKTSQLRTDFELINYGMPVRLDLSGKLVPHDELRLCHFTIAGLLTLAAEGADVRIVNELDAVKIYEIIDQYVQAWILHGDRDLNGPITPISDLLVMEKYAKTLHDQVGHLLPQRSTGGLFQISTALANMQNLASGEFPNKKPETQAPQRRDWENELVKMVSRLSGGI